MPTFGDKLWNWIVAPQTPGATTYGGTSPIAGTGIPNQSGQTIPSGTPDTWDLPVKPADGVKQNPSWFDLFPDNYVDVANEQKDYVVDQVTEAVNRIGKGLTLSKDFTIVAIVLTVAILINRK